MKKMLFVALCALCVCSVRGTAHAAPLTIPSVPIMVIDTWNDNDTTVRLSYTNDVPGFDFGYLDKDSLFITLVEAGYQDSRSSVWNGGDIIDFAIRNAGNGAVYSLGDSNGVNYATLVFSGDVSASYAENPERISDYWDTVNIRWGIPTGIDGVGTQNFDTAVARGGDGDGLAPVPEPATMSLLGMGVLGLLGLKRRKA